MLWVVCTGGSSTLVGQPVPGQPGPTAQPGPVQLGSPTPPAPPKAVLPRPDAPGPDEILTSAVLRQEMEGPIRKLRVNARLETTEMLLKADEIDYNEQTGYAEARGNVYFENYDSGEQLWAARIEYNLKESTGKFYEVRGSATTKIDYRPGLLMTTNPFVFEGKWAEKFKDRYLLYDGFVTNCKLPKPFWRLTAPKFDIIPNDRAIAYRSFFKVRKIPILYTPAFYKALSEQPRRSGFLTPNFGRSTRLGWMYGIGYFWAINRSYDAMYRTRLFTQRGLSHEIDFRGKPREGTDFNFTLYGVGDRGRLLDNGDRVKEGGYQFRITGKSEIGRGWTAMASVSYLSSFLFRQSFTQSFNEGIDSEVNATGVATKHFGYNGFHGVLSRHQLFQGANEADKISIRKLPSFEFFVREHEVSRKVLPIWFSMESSASLFRRRQLLFETRSFTERFAAAPRLSTAVEFRGFRILPSITIHGAAYGSRRDAETLQVMGQNLQRFASDFQVDIITPTLEKIFEGPRWMGGGTFKHVIEPRMSFRRVDGVNRFRETLRLDELDVLNNTTEGEVTLINRIFAKREGRVDEILTWQIWHRRYFDPTFGGAVVPGQRNVFASTIGLTGYAFFSGPRSFSPVVSALRMNPWQAASVEWRFDYDPLLRRPTNSSLVTDFRVKKVYFWGIGHNLVRGDRVNSPNTNQLLMRGGYGGIDRVRGWRVSFNGVYDYIQATMPYATTEVSYTSDCCGLSIQHRFLNYGTRRENQYLVSFSVANIGSFGTLRKQERMF